MQVVYKVINYYHFTDTRTMCYGKATLRKNNHVSALGVNVFDTYCFLGSK